ncbi:RNA polymerase alpha subunit C-terminal domain-containing protein [Ravibacter arvi]|uniref:RNA polymerase alpha subunit C-terminal domain-containing protein n=1 Tax=Ravibacter arvi TaxID=2051041 RepID=UPI0031E77837
MSNRTKTTRVCPNGHRYEKSTDCPTCPVCEKENKPADGFLSILSSPARNALLHAGILTLSQLAGHSEKEILGLHGMGPGSIPKLRAALSEAGLAFKNSPEE